MSERDVRSDEPDGHTQRLHGDRCSSGREDGGQPLFYLGGSRESLARAVTKSASAAYIRVAALASCLLDASVISAMIFLISSSSARLIAASDFSQSTPDAQ